MWPRTVDLACALLLPLLSCAASQGAEPVTPVAVPFASGSAQTPEEAAEQLRRSAARLRLAVEDLAASFPGRYPKAELLERLAQWERRLAGAKPEALASPDAEPLLAEFRALRRDALVARNPLLCDRPILFVKRFAYAGGWYYADFMRAGRFGGGLFVLSPADGQVRELVPKLRGGIFDRYDLSFDGRRVVFGYKAAPGKGFRLYEVGADGSGLKQLSFDPPDEPQRIEKYWHPSMRASGVYRHHTDDFHPCYLPDGGIALASTRCEHGVLCDQGDSLAVNVLYRMEADGTRLRPLSHGALSESTPTVANDGRILYTRWEYVDKGVIAVQALWTMRPDGSGAREVFGNQIEDPPVLIHGRAVPGTSHRFVCTCTLHHPFAVGPLALVDARRDVRTLEPVEWLTPETGLSIAQPGTFPRGECFTHLRGGQWVADNRGPLYCDPHPLSDPETGAGAGKYFLAACNPDRPWNDAAAYGLVLLDVFGNETPIYSDPAISCWQPMPLVARPVPPVLPATGLAGPVAETGPDEATLLLADVYQGLEGVGRGTVKYVRVWEQVPRPWAARRFWPHDETLGQHAVISLNAHVYVKVLHGVVPVREDGSACFTVPAGKNLFFQALDEDFMEVQRMRSFVDLRPGETRSCVGCHEPRGRAPPNTRPLALDRPPDRPGPQPGETVPRPLYYPTDVQPLLDRHCVRCHNRENPEGGLDLTGELTQFFSRSYEELIRKNQLAVVQEFIGPDPDAQKSNAVYRPPMSLGSHASRLIRVLREGHYEVKLAREEWVRLVTWVDANGPYYGSYFGRRNLIYRGHPDFRPAPTLEPPPWSNALGRAQ